MIAEALHDTAGALDAYTRFLAVAPSRFDTQREEAGERLNALSGEGAR